MSDGELDLSLSPVKRSQASQGRRAGEARDSWLEDEENPQPQPRRRGNTGWAVRSQHSQERQEEKEEGEEEEEEDLPIIPDLEEVEKEDFAQRVADAPNVAVNRVDTYRELDSDLFKHAAFATLEEVDLRLLTRQLVPESAVKEPDETWSWETLFAEVSSHIQSDWRGSSETCSATDSKEAGPDPGQAENERPYTAFNKFPV